MKNEYINKSYEKQAEFIIKNLRKRNIEANYFKETPQAVEYVCRLIEPGNVVGLGGSVTVVESGLIDALRKLNIELLDRYKQGVSDKEIFEMRKRGMTADVLVASCNAITMDGKIVSEDGLGNRVGGMVYGPEKVILLVGMNKVVRDVEHGIERIRTVAAPFNSIRFGVDTPCARTGFCDEPACLPPARICNQLVIIESNATIGRLHVVLVGEHLGF